MDRKRSLGLILGPLAYILTLYFGKNLEIEPDALSVLAGTIWIAIWWVMEPIPIAVTSLLPLFIFPISGALSIEQVASSYGDKYIFLYAGGFMLAIAIEKWNLHKRIALLIINSLGVNLNMIILGFMISTAFLSMWISNTATAVMMLPIGLAIIKQMHDNPITKENENTIFGKALMLGIAYSASIGGFATLVGTPPNLVFAGVIKELYGTEISFAKWMLFATPLSFILLIITWYYLTNIAYKFKDNEFPGGKKEIKNQLAQLGKISIQEKRVVIVFFLTGFAWITKSVLLNKFYPNLDDTMIAIISAVSLFIIPANSKRPLLEWDEAVKLPWGILFLFGGGLALAKGFQETGLANWLGQKLIYLEGYPLFIILFVIITAINFMTEFTSNLATTAMILPILATLAQVLDIHPYVILVGATLAASCAFMFPVATPPNAVVFGSGYLKVIDMAKTGFALNIISIILIYVFVYFVMPYLWGLNPLVFPF